MSDIAVSESPIAEDTPCPSCQYNLRGLITPRCPECGAAFRWADVESFRMPPDTPARGPWPALVIVLAPILIIVGIASDGICFLAPVFLALPLLVTMTQAGGEYLVLRACPIDALAGRYWNWWKGTILGDTAVLAFASYVLGHPFSSFRLIDCFLDPFVVWHMPTSEQWILRVGAFEITVLAQWWTLARLRRHEVDAPSHARLLMACILTKGLTHAALLLWLLARR